MSNIVSPDLHVAIIMDGNSRWAKKRFLPTAEGHRRGAKNLRSVCEYSLEFGIKYLTVYAFSTENWNRPQQEVNDLMDLLRHYLKSELDTLHKMNIRLAVIGNLSMLSSDINNMIAAAIHKTKDNTGLYLNIALSYGARDEIVNATKRIAKLAAYKQITIDDIDTNLFEKHLYTSHLPDVDILIRTGGDYRVSNFLLWQISYAEMFFTDTLWPDFSKEDLSNIVTEFNQRTRRFGSREAI